jgi:hypothetical protein
LAALFLLAFFLRDFFAMVDKRNGARGTVTRAYPREKGS